MAGDQHDPLAALSEAIAARATAAPAFTVAIRTRHHIRSGVLWRDDVVVASQQVFPRESDAAIVFADGRSVTAEVAGRDPGTNVIALRLGQPAAARLPAAVEPQLGGLALCFAATGSGSPSVRLTLVRALGAAWHSLAGGLIDRRIALDLLLSGREEGGPVVDAGGGLLGMSTAGPGGRALVIPGSVIERALEPLLTSGRIARGWLGVALHPVALPDSVSGAAEQRRGLMVMQVKADGPAARAGIHPGDILLKVGDVAATHAAQLGRILGPDSIGRAIELRLIRAGAELTLQAAITARPAA